MSESTDQKDWPELIQIGPPQVPAFPVDALPTVLADWVSAESEATQTPPDMAALLALAVCSAVLARRLTVEPWKGWTEPVNIYAAAILEPANRKSAVFRAAEAPLRALQRTLAKECADEIVRQRSQRRQSEQRLKVLERQAAESDDAKTREATGDEAERLAMELAETQTINTPTLIVDDATPEKLAVLMEQNAERIACMSAEGGVFDLMAGKYTGGAANLDIYLKGHCGDAIRSDRMNRTSVNLESPAITMALAIQPDVIRGLAEKSSFRGRGLLGRFLYAVPQSWIGSRKIGPPPVPIELSNAYEQTVQRLAGVESSECKSLVLDQRATIEFTSFCEWTEVELGRGSLELMRDWGGKLAGLTARLAAIMHCVKHSIAPHSVPIDYETILNAKRIGQWAIPHAEAALGLLSAAQLDMAAADAEYIIRWLKDPTRVRRRFDRRDVHRHGHRRFNGQPERLDSALNLLEETHHIARVKEKQPGGKKSYEVSPRLFADCCNRPSSPLSPRFSQTEDGQTEVII